MRVCHYLKANKLTELPHSVAFVDTETTPKTAKRGAVTHHLKFGWAAYQRTIRDGEWAEPEWARFTARDAFWTWLEGRTRPRTRTYVFAHNWTFDAPVLGLFEELPKRGWKLQRAVIEGPPVILVYRRDSRTLAFLDTLNWWRVPLRELGASIGLPKLEMPAPGDSQELWDAYGKQDVEIIRRAVLAWIAFLKTHDLGGFATTLAGQSLRTFRHRFMTHEILIDDNPQALRLSRDAYHGGRCECSQLGKVRGPVYVVDVNSQYPSVMLSEDYPVKLVGWTQRVTLDDLRRWLRDRCVVARCIVRTDVPAYAHVHDGRLCFPVGTFRESLTTPELRYGLERGHIVGVEEAAVYTRGRIFEAFVREMYAHRLDAKARGDAVSTFLFKILLNSLYGKFGQQGGKWEMHSEAPDLSIRVWDEYDYDTGTLRAYRQFGGVIQTRLATGEARESFPAIAAHVTAYARHALWQLILRAGRPNLHYCDTDSLWLTKQGYERVAALVDPLQLGAIKREDVHDWAIFHGPKDYQVPGRRRTKGVRASARWLTSDTVTQERWTGIRGLLRSGTLDAPRTETTRKKLRREYRKGNVDSAGHVTPLVLSLTPDSHRRSRA